MMHNVCKLNKQDDNIQPCCASFPVLNQSFVLCPVLTCFLTHRQVSRRQVRWSGTPISWRIFQFVLTHIVKGFSVVNEAEEDVFLALLCFLSDWANVGNLIFGSSSSSKPTLHIWKFTVDIPQKPSLKDFEHNLTNMWNECNCIAVFIDFKKSIKQQMLESVWRKGKMELFTVAGNVNWYNHYGKQYGVSSKT